MLENERADIDDADSEKKLPTVRVNECILANRPFTEWLPCDWSYEKRTFKRRYHLDDEMKATQEWLLGIRRDFCAEGTEKFVPCLDKY